MWHLVGQSGRRWLCAPRALLSALLLKWIVERMFLGEYQHLIDDKSRLTIPAKFREALAKGCVITRGFEKNLIIYTTKEFGELIKRSHQMSATDPESRDLKRFIFAGASEATPDKSGRVLIPPALRTHAALESEVYVIGVGQHIEVWSKPGWEEQLVKMSDPEANSRRFAALNLSTGT